MYRWGFGGLNPETSVYNAADSAEEYTDYLLNDTSYKIQDYSQSLIGSKAHIEWLDPNIK